uniref:Uncharacterized protein n=1 Tax=Pyxicephalus adspersus TaxID=30357 RepID=A0AAV3B5D7_PYXAD|nr:TPA: hypothetical protein GDO54_006539 [Pyxicephalus adspersus]
MAMGHLEVGSLSFDLVGEHGISHMTWLSFCFVAYDSNNTNDSQACLREQRAVCGKTVTQNKLINNHFCSDSSTLIKSEVRLVCKVHCSPQPFTVSLNTFDHIDKFCLSAFV